MMGVSTCSLLLITVPFLYLEVFFACRFFLGLALSSGAANALRTGSLKQSRKVS